MTVNVTYSLKIIRDYTCCRVGAKILVKSTGRVACDSFNKLFNEGLVEIHEPYGHVTITYAGLTRILPKPTDQTLARARKFLNDGDSFYLMDDRLYGSQGGYISRYVAEHFINDKTLVLNQMGRYVHNVTMVPVFSGELSMVRALLRHLRNAPH